MRIEKTAAPPREIAAVNSLLLKRLKKKLIALAGSSAVPFSPAPVKLAFEKDLQVRGENSLYHAPGKWKKLYSGIGYSTLSGNYETYLGDAVRLTRIRGSSRSVSTGLFFSELLRDIPDLRANCRDCLRIRFIENITSILQTKPAMLYNNCGVLSLSACGGGRS